MKDDPLKPAEVLAYTALVAADPEAEMRRELVDMIHNIVYRQVMELLHSMAHSGELDALLAQTRQHMEKEEMLRHIRSIDSKLRNRY